MKSARLLILCSLFFVFPTAYGAGINFLNSKPWKEILAQAKRENKLVFLDAFASWCGPCKYLQNEVFTNNEAGDFYNRSFINVKMDMEEGEGVTLSEELGVQSYPTLFFINGDGEIVHKKVGAMKVPEFLELGAHALNPDQQFYTLKKKATASQLSPTAFHSWIHTAEELEDPDLDDIIRSYLATVQHPRKEKEMLTIMLDHASLNEEQLRFLHTNRDQCQPLSGKSNEEFTSALLKRVIYYATIQSGNNEGVDFESFQKIISSYFPADAALETQKLKIRYYNYIDSNEMSLDLLVELISTPAFRLKVDGLSSLIINYTKEIASEGRAEEFIQKVQAYKVPAADQTKAYHKDLALLALYLAKGDRAQLEACGKKILADGNAPQEVKTSVEKVLNN